MTEIGTLVRDDEYPRMWRVVTDASGELSDMLNRQRAVELGRLLVLEQRNKGKARIEQVRAGKEMVRQEAQEAARREPRREARWGFG